MYVLYSCAAVVAEDGFLTILYPQNVFPPFSCLLAHLFLLLSYFCCVLRNVTEDSRSVQTTWRKKLWSRNPLVVHRNNHSTRKQ